MNHNNVKTINSEVQYKKMIETPIDCVKLFL